MGSTRHDNPFSATMAGIGDLFGRKKPIGRLDETDRIDGKTCLVTGANRGLGKAVAVGLARRGGRIVMACRAAYPEAVRDVRRRSGNPSVEAAFIDLADIRTIHAFCDLMKERGVRFDIAVLNAGIVPARARRTEQGFEAMFGVNYLANFILVNRLLSDGTLPNRTFAKRHDPSGRAVPRIVFVSSEAHRTAGPVALGSLGHFRDYRMGGSLKEYGLNKLLLTLFASELSRRLAGREVDVAVHSLCPGPVNTGIAREAPWWSQPLLRFVFYLFFKTPRQASEPVLYLCCSRSLEGRTGVYLHLMTEKRPSAQAMDPDLGRRLWKKSEELANGGPCS